MEYGYNNLLIYNALRHIFSGAKSLIAMFQVRAGCALNLCGDGLEGPRTAGTRAGERRFLLGALGKLLSQNRRNAGAGKNGFSRRPGNAMPCAWRFRDPIAVAYCEEPAMSFTRRLEFRLGGGRCNRLACPRSTLTVTARIQIMVDFWGLGRSA